MRVDISTLWLRRVAAVAAALVAGGMAPVASGSAPGAGSPHPPPALAAVDPAAVAEALADVPPPALPADWDATVLSGMAEVAGATDRQAAVHGTLGVHDVDQRIDIDGFERADWPAGSTGYTRWLPQTLRDLRRPGGGYHWASSDCRGSTGDRALCAVCGGPAAAVRRCGDLYPAGAASSVLLLLDLSRHRQVERLDLVLDIWADAAPDEGVLVNYLRYDSLGELLDRRTIYSATGRLRDWARSQRLNLLAVRDQLDPAWRANLAGQIVYVEFLFLSQVAMPGGEGVYIDNLAIESRPSTVAVTPVPTPSIGNFFCPAGATCGTLQVEGFIDYRCDGRFNSGVDRRLNGDWVDILAGATPIGAKLGTSGSAFFRLPIDADVRVTLIPPPGHKMCANSPSPVTLVPADFGRYKRKKLTFRVVP